MYRCIDAQVSVQIDANMSLTLKVTKIEISNTVSRSNLTLLGRKFCSSINTIIFVKLHSIVLRITVS